jgi:hypothetical protein
MLIIKKVDTPKADQVIIQFLLFSLGFSFVGILATDIAEFHVTLTDSQGGKLEADAVKMLERAEYGVECIP